MATLEKSLLPQGFHDHLPPQAAAEMKLNGEVIRSITLFGYELVRPALMEFEESLDKDFTSDFFKVTDTISGKMMVIRNDITPQIVRIVKDRYGEQALEKTVRLAYTGQVIRKKGSGKFTERQLTQTGFELVSENTAERDAEVLYVAIETMQAAGFDNFTIDLCYPKLTQLILKKYNFNVQQLEEITRLIEEKDINSLSNFQNNEEIIKIMQICDRATDITSAVQSLEMLEDLDLPEVTDIFTKIRDILNIISRSVPQLNISLNLLETMGFGYHSGLCYSFISRKNFEEIGRGGRYKISLGKQKLSAAGFTFLINSMLRSVTIENRINGKTIKYSEGFSASKKLRESGTTTIFE